MADSTTEITTDEMHAYGYLWDGMKPLDSETAEKIFLEGNKVIYCLYPDNTEGAADTLEDIHRHAQHGGIFGIED